MVEKTKGIVLHQIKYSDSGIIVWIYSRKFGRLSFLVRGTRNRKSGKHSIFFQSLSILDIDIRYRESREIQSLREYSVSYSPVGIINDIRKSCVAIFLGEVLSAVLREETPNEELYDFLEEAIIHFDQSKEKFANFHIAFLARLSRFLGFEPAFDSWSGQGYFDFLNGSFSAAPPDHRNFTTGEISGIVASFFNSSFQECEEIKLTGSVRNEILSIILNYYSVHLPGIKTIRSLEVLKEVFSR